MAEWLEWCRRCDGQPSQRCRCELHPLVTYPLDGAEDLKIERAALFAWWNSDSATEQAPSEVWWDNHKDCWTDGWEAGYRACLRLVDGAQIDGDER